MGARDEFKSGLPDVNERDSREYTFHPQDFERVRKIIYARAGISVNESKQNMVYSRLARRLRTLRLDSFSAYLDKLERDAAFGAAEAQSFINALTTNLTSFFREPHHFPVLAEFLKSTRSGAPARIWCSAASTGEEPYSIAISMAEALGDGHGARLIATDIDTDVIAAAARGVYRLEAARGCGESRLRRFFLRGKGANEGSVRIRPELARSVEFAPLNLLSESWPQIGKFAPKLDVIFCRNVMIYFDKPTQRVILGRMARLLRPRGLLIVGHSENFTDCRDTFTPKGKTVYERTGA